jgi:hypothetical protein
LFHEVSSFDFAVYDHDFPPLSLACEHDTLTRKLMDVLVATWWQPPLRASTLARVKTHRSATEWTEFMCSQLLDANLFVSIVSTRSFVVWDLERCATQFVFTFFHLICCQKKKKKKKKKKNLTRKCSGQQRKFQLAGEACPVMSLAKLNERRFVVSYRDALVAYELFTAPAGSADTTSAFPSSASPSVSIECCEVVHFDSSALPADHSTILCIEVLDDLVVRFLSLFLLLFFCLHARVRVLLL